MMVHMEGNPGADELLSGLPSFSEAAATKPTVENPEETASWPSVLIWQWLQPLISIGASRPLEHADLPQLRTGDSIWAVKDVLKGDNGAFHALCNCYGWKYFGPVMLLQPFWLLFSVLQVYAVRELIGVVTANGDERTWVGALYALSMFGSSFLQALAMHHTFRHTMKYGMRARAALSAKIYAKTLKLRQASAAELTPQVSGEQATRAARKKKGSGSVTEGTNVLTNDTQRIVDAFTYVPFLLFNPIVVITVAVALCFTLGASALIGVAVMLLIVPLQGVFGRHTAKLRAKTIAETDARVALQGEVIQGIRIIKYGAWENIFAEKIRVLRRREFKWLLRSGLLDAVNSSIFFLATSTVAFVTFLAFTVLAGRELTPEAAFLSIALFNIISRSLVMLPRAVKAASESVVSLRRIDNYLALPEIRAKHPAEVEKGAVHFRNATLAWREDSEPVLTDISLAIPPSSMTAVIGKVGSGKSSLIMGILNELQVLGGDIDVAGKISYAAQVPWIISGSVKDNITVGDGHRDEERYEAVLKACCLSEDLALLPAGDQTEIGERGVNLSGGQKARLSLARAFYAKADIILLDDPLSAVDVRVAGELTRNLFSPEFRSLFGRSTIVLVTHNFDAISGFDNIVALESKAIIFSDNHDAFKISKVFADLSQKRPNDTSIGPGSEFQASQSKSDGFQKIQAALIDVPQTSNGHIVPAERTFLVEAEGRELGNLSTQVYVDYMKAGGGIIVAILLGIAFALAQAMRQWSDFWIAIWSSDAENRIRESSEKQDNLSYALVYFGLTMGTLVLSLFRTSAYIVASRVASKRIHDQLLTTVMKATQQYFDTNPVGRILNRFAKDMDQMDDLLPITAVDFIQIAFLALGAIASIAIVVPWMLLLLGPISLLYIYIQRLYVKSSRELKRLEGVSRSPIYSQFSETLAGTATIRAYGIENQFCTDFFDKVDYNHQAYYSFISSARWLAVRLDFLASVIVFFTSLLITLVRGSIDPGLAGLAITQSMLTTSIFQWGVRQAAETETLFTSVERVTTMVKETSLEPSAAASEPKVWPSSGSMTWKSVCMRYRKDLPLALNNLSFSIAGGQKVGIVGRTGAGKSSLTTALFRMVELSSGSIVVDGIDIASVSLSALRRAIAIVPQDPVLFTGTIRENIDPTGEIDDYNVNLALKSVRFTDLRELTSGLDTKVGDGGNNFSVGERQLLCLARALVSKSKIIVLDEATAAVDNRTDSLMQLAIRESFKRCTVITIAHRLHTVADCDRVLVLSQGQLHANVELTVAEE